MDFLGNFIREQDAIGGMTGAVSHCVKSLYDEYKLPQLEPDCSIISAEFGKLGSLVVHEVSFFTEATVFKYMKGDYDYVSVSCDKTTRILWTDYEDIEPYNRNGGLYCDGASFDILGKPVVETDTYREFVHVSTYGLNTTIPVWGYSYNDCYHSVRFGLCLKTDKVEEFVSILRNIISKPSKIK